MMLLTWEKHRWKSMKLAGQKDYTKPTKREFAQSAYCQVKSILKNKLQVEQSARATGQPDAIVIDGCAILWDVHWSSKGSVQDLLQIL